MVVFGGVAVYLRMQGVNTNDHPIKAELVGACGSVGRLCRRVSLHGVPFVQDRVKQYFAKIKNAEKMAGAFAACLCL